MAQRGRSGFTLIELLVVIFIIGVIASLLLPAINAARSSARTAQCANRLRQIGIGLNAISASSPGGQYCTGAMQWSRFGAVTERGWVADLVAIEVPVGEMLCPVNISQLSVAYDELVLTDPSTSCVDPLGSPTKTLPDGSTEENPCRAMHASGSGLYGPASPARRQFVEQEIYERFYNTNYCASWLLAHSGPNLDSSGNVVSKVSGCSVDISHPNSTLGPLTAQRLDTSDVMATTVIIMGDGKPLLKTLTFDMGPVSSGELMCTDVTEGPVLKTTMALPTFGSGTPREGASGWWGVWNKQVLQDYTRFGTPHRGGGNFLFADSSVRFIEDVNDDGVLNNGFPANSVFADAIVDMNERQTFSGYSMSR